ncbi:sporulation protein YqfD [Chryseomicrobium sp. FSL W7-1435]|uniref:sporulation protein YqfD n=1 Tax=Chryseomicrobium sp. FSL W7-1435 TaxID=2921704 RepID=UPI00315A97F5
MRFKNYRIKARIEGTEQQLQKFLTLLYELQKVPLYNLQRLDGYLYFEMNQTDISTIKSIRFQAGVRLSLTHTSFHLFRNPLLIVALLIFLALPLASHYFYFSVSITGDEAHQQAVEDYLLKEKLTFPLLKKELPPIERIRNELMKKHASMAWVMIDKESAELTISIVPAPDPIDPQDWPEATKFVAAYDGQIERVQLLAGESLVERKSIVSKGDILAIGSKGEKAKGIIVGTYWREIEFELLTKEKKFDFESSHLSELIRQFVTESKGETTIQGVKVLQVQNENGKVRGKVLVKIQGIITKPEYLKETLND